MMNATQRVRFLAHASLEAHRARLKRSRAAVREALAKCKSPYIALSGGKDSACVAHLVWEQSPDIPAVYFDADCAFPEVKDYLVVLESNGKRIIRFQCRPFLQVIKTFGLHSDAVEEATMRYTVREPLRQLYERFGYDGVFLGIRAEESPDRKVMLNRYGGLFVRKSDSKTECNPVGYWSFADVWAYLLSGNHPYCAAYDKLFNMNLPEASIRISYWAGETGRRWGRYEALRHGWPELWQRLCDEVTEAKSYG